MLVALGLNGRPQVSFLPHSSDLRRIRLTKFVAVFAAIEGLASERGGKAASSPTALLVASRGITPMTAAVCAVVPSGRIKKTAATEN